jgi:soluble P-type ATPase
MLNLSIPGAPPLSLAHLVLDFNGTLACAGILLDGAAQRLRMLSTQFEIHVLTGDTFGTAAAALSGLPCSLHVLDGVAQAQAKRDHVCRLGAEAVACVGDGRNDQLTMRQAALAIVVLQREGAYPPTLAEADIVVPTVCDALDLLLHPLRLVATLRG